MMLASPRIVVVGAGIIGASIAWHLTAAGASVTVVDAGEAGGVATPNSFAWINASAGNPEPYYRLRIRAMAEWRRLAMAVPDLPLVWCGGLCWDMEPAELEAYAQEHGGWGYGIRRVDRAEAAQIEPALTTPPDFALHVAAEGVAEPVPATLALLADATRRGARLQPRTAVTGLIQGNGKVSGVHTTAGSLSADEVVLAAGAETPRLAALAGIAIPLTTPPGLIVHSRPHGKLLNGLVMTPELHMRQTLDGRIVAAADYGGIDPGSDPQATARELFAQTRTMLRAGASLELDFHTIGYRPIPQDGFPVIGRPEAVAGLYVAVMHSGITLAPAVGLFTADEILAGRRDPLLAAYGPARFA